ncbi:MAG: cell division protein FtsK [Planctomycetaceae bacterium]|nr:cell division protein FtsK [Planctomycetaceae bacterium]
MSTSDASTLLPTESLTDSATTDPLAPESQRDWWRRLQALVEKRVQAERESAEEFRIDAARIEKELAVANAARTETHERERAAIQAEYDKTVIEAGTQFADDHAVANQEFQDVVFAIQQRAADETETARKKHEEDRWMVTSYFDEEAEGSPKQQYEVFQSNVAKSREQLKIEADELEAEKMQIDLLMLKRRQGIEVEPPTPEKIAPTNDLDTAAAQFREACEAVKSHHSELQRLKIPAMFQGKRPYFAALGAWFVLWGIAGFAIDPKMLFENNLDALEWRVVAGVLMLFPVGITMGILLSVGRGQTAPIYELVFDRHLAAQRLRQRWQKLADSEVKHREEKFAAWQKVVTAKREAGLKKADHELAATSQKIEARRVEEHAAANQKYPALLSAITQRRDQQMAWAHAEFPQRLEKLKTRFEFDLKKYQQNHDSEVENNTKRFQQTWLRMAQEWLEGWQQLDADADAANQIVDKWFHDWATLGSAPLKLPPKIPPGIRMGHFSVALSDVPDGVPKEPQLVPERMTFELPACLPFPNRPSLLLKAKDAGREVAVAALQNSMLRFLTTLPGGKVRFTILDPVGLGDNFAAFMHLADYDELLITSRIWTEQGQIEHRLSDLTEHMENVFQKYLRNEFRSIQEYNEHAGEVAEPYHILVVANFPANFSEAASRRLVSIATSGPRCGVFLLASVDTKLRLPLNFDLHDLATNATVFEWNGTTFTSSDDELKALPLTLDAPPEPDLFTKLVKAAGHESKDARRVEVAFERIAPKDAQLWASDTRSGLDVPLGRAGATKLQHLRLGKGTSQHVLIAGKTGSGKSTFLHILITNAVLHYGPDQLHFYLIDFKKGVEFKTYATHELPHARVIAIESDREFGVSVLERLDAILKERGDLFRDVGVQDLAGFRDARPGETMPRILQVVDEIQEYFVEDDKHAQTSALLLDRLVRQGRAFGIHVLLGSQTLGGAYSLARSTLGQMAVRIALQCSESDAHLILSEDNTAARLLTRPGEAIYNDANGLLEGNHPFQIAWLEDDRREFHLDRVQHMTEKRQVRMPPAIVFEGNIPADPRRNVELSQLIDAPQWDAPLQDRVAWLGEAVAIKDPTAIRFHSQGGQNLLVVGQSDLATVGLLATSIISLACQVRPNAATGEPPVATFFILDGNFGGVSTETWKELQAALPHSFQIGEPRDTQSVLATLSAEMTRREQSGSRDDTPIFVVIFNLGRFRDLKKSDDDMGFSFGGGEKKVSPSKQFTDLLKNGPNFGIHTLVWSDTYNNVSRWFSSQTLREFEVRIVFQLSASDSSNLIDGPLASKLGPNRAILHSVDQGTNEKFRPYGPPTAEWLSDVASRLQPTTTAEEEIGEPISAGEDLSQFTIL